MAPVLATKGSSEKAREIDLGAANGTVKKLRLSEPLLWLFLLFWCGLGLLAVYREVEAWQARIEIRKVLQAPDSELVVTVNGRLVPDNRAVLRALRGVHLRTPHHSHPDQEAPVTIAGPRGRLELTLARDSALAGEYWVFRTLDAKSVHRLEIGWIDGMSMSPTGDD